MRKTPGRVLLAFLVTLTLLLGGCTDADDRKRTADEPDGAPDGGNITNETQPEPVSHAVGLTGAYPVTIAYDPARIEVPAGSNVTITFTNSDSNPVPPHDWVLEGYEDSAATEVIDNGQTSEVTFAAPPVGTYAFYCSVPGHRDNGMEGTFVVA